MQPGECVKTVWKTLWEAYDRLSAVPRDICVTILALSGAYYASSILLNHTGAENNSALVFALSVALISFLTTGYFYGVVAAVLGAFFTNYYFMAPYAQFSLSRAGYPVATLSMLAISLLICALTARVKRQKEEAVRREQNTKKLYELNEKLNQEKNAIELQSERERIRGNILRAVSHDLRTPLTAICGNAGILLSDGDTLTAESRMQMYRDIYDDSAWLHNLVENLLTVTRIEEGRMELKLQPQLVEEIVAEAMQHISRNKAAHCITVSHDDDLLLARCDARLIIQVLINLVDNAIKYTPAGSSIVIQTKEEQGNAVICVADDGPGIPDAEKAKVFQMFYTGSNPIADSRRSIGLGLSLCKSIMTAHGGSIRVSDNQPKGTRFTVTIPSGEVEVHE